jgi:hypothetical protein
MRGVAVASIQTPCHLPTLPVASTRRKKSLPSMSSKRGPFVGAHSGEKKRKLTATDAKDRLINQNGDFNRLQSWFTMVYILGFMASCT